jgi:hypothetical protein
MIGSGTTLPPQVLRRDDKSFVIHNVNIEALTQVQRIALGIQVWEQVRALLEAAGEYKPRDPNNHNRGVGGTEDVDRAVAAAVGVSWSTINLTRPRGVQRPDVMARAAAGEFAGSNDLKRALGMQLQDKLEEGAKSKARLTSSFYGKSDKFDLAFEPVTRYLRAWRKKDFRFTHVNPKEAKKRIAKIDEVIAGLVQAREDLADRSHVATYRAPQERRRENST